MLHFKIRAFTDGMHISRFHTQRTILTDTVGRHSCGVALLCAELTEDRCSVSLLKAALLHDLAEYCTGDIPSPMKRHFGAAIGIHENKYLQSAGLPTMEDLGLTAEEARVLSIADKLDGLLYCIAEINMGNSTMLPIAKKYVSYLNDMNLKGREALLFMTIQLFSDISL